MFMLVLSIGVKFKKNWENTQNPDTLKKYIFTFLSITSIFALLVVGTYQLIADLSGEERRGTLNFIRLSPQDLMRQALDIGLKGLAITDHHSIEGYRQAQIWLENQHLKSSLPHLWTGVEITANLLDTEVHILGYGFDPAHVVLTPYLQRTKPEGDLALASRVINSLQQAGALVRIKAPKEMGKTSLLLRMLDFAKQQGYRTVSLNLEQVDQAILSDLNQFLRWLCANAARQLQLKPQLDEYWDEDLGSKISCTVYIQDYLLESITAPIVLALDELNQIFEHPQVAKDFLPLLRSWYEEAKTLPIWQKLRLIVVHSTEIYVRYKGLVVR